MPRFLVVSVCLASVSFAPACGDDDGDGGSTNVSTGLPRSDELSSLNDDDAVQACVNTARSFNNVLSESQLERISCVVLAVSTILAEGGEGSSAITECNEIVNDCLSGELDGEAIDIDITIVTEADCGNARASATFETCDATVGDYEDCASEVKKELHHKLTSISCDGLRDADELEELLNSEIDVSDAPKCKALQDECPSIDFSG